MNYKQALAKLKRYQFGIVVKDSVNKEGEPIYYVERLKGDQEIEEITETKINGTIVAVKSGSEIYIVNGFEGGGEQ